MVEIMLRFAYGHQLHYPTQEASLENVMFALGMSRVATKYDFPEHEEMAAVGFAIWLSRFCDRIETGDGPTLEDLAKIIKAVFDITKRGRVIESLVHVLTTNPYTCQFRTWDSISVSVKCVAESESLFEDCLREELGKVRPEELEALNNVVLGVRCPVCNLKSMKPSGKGGGGFCLTCGTFESGWHRL
jgi:hypothetical protein